MTARTNSLRGLLVRVTVFLAAAAVAPVNAQELPAGATSAAPSNADANNPLAQFTAFNIFVEPQYTILDRGAGQPELQIFVGFNTQFVKK